jgi:hypothetical protein
MDFKQKLEQRKQEILQQKGVIAAPAESTFEDRFDAIMYRVSATLRKYLVGACLFCLLFTYFLFTDWWGFVGSPEYTSYKQRVERGIRK